MGVLSRSELFRGGVHGVGERIWAIFCPPSLSFCRITSCIPLDAGLEKQVGIECLEFWVNGFPGGRHSVGKDMELRNYEAWLGMAGRSLSGICAAE